jgi:hypothetical protein
MCGQGDSGSLQRSRLLGRRDRVFEVEEHGVGGGRGGIFHVSGAMRGDGQIGPGQSRRGHEVVSSNRPNSAKKIASVFLLPRIAGSGVRTEYRLNARGMRLCCRCEVG